MWSFTQPATYMSFLRNEPHALVVADHLRRHARGVRGLADVHRSVHRRRPHAVAWRAGWARAGAAGASVVPRQRRSVSALVTTLTLLNAIAAPAITGLSMPSAASGMPSTL